MNATSVTLEQLKKAVSIKEQINSLQDQLSALLTGVSSDEPGAKRRGISAEARERIAAAQRVRWAKIKGQPAKTKSSSLPERRTMSAASKAKIAAAAKARWAKAKAAGKRSL